MHLSDFMAHLRKNDCEFTPMPDWRKASTLLITHKSGRTAYLNTFYEDVWENVVEEICVKKLWIPLPENYQD